MKLAVLGTGTLAVEVATVAEEAGFDVTCFVENLDRQRCAAEIGGRPVRWVDEVPELVEDHRAVAGIATVRRSDYVGQVARLGLRFATVVHPSARIPASARLGEGTVVHPHVVVGAEAVVGEHVILNRGVLVGHHTTVGDFATLQPGANVAGLCTVEERAFLGMASVVVDRRRVGREAVVGAGAVVLDDVPPNVQVVGVPARVVREGVEGR